jgi:hypothetical protein
LTAALPAHSDPARDSPAAPGEPRALAPAADDLPLDRQIFQAIEGLTRQTGRPPTYREVLAYTGIRSHRRLSDGLNELVRTGKLARLTGSRNLIVVQPPRTAGSG